MEGKQETTGIPTSVGERKPRSEITYVVLVMAHDEEHGLFEDSWEVAGTTWGATKAKAWEAVLDGKAGIQLAIPTELGPTSVRAVPVRLVPESAWGEAFPVRAAQKVVFEGGPAVVFEGGLE
jgi:hypothetical protein